MKTHCFRYAGVLLAAWCMGAPAGAQQGKLTGPVAGFVYDSAAHVLRSIQGVPGASVMGDAVDFGFNVASAYVSPRQDSVFVTGADGVLHLFKLNAGAVTEVGLNGISFAPQRMAFSPSGTAAAFLVAGRVQVFKGLPDAPALAGSIVLRPPTTAAVKTNGEAPLARRATAPPFAISDDGTYLLNVASGSVWLLSVNGENRRLLSAEADAQVAFAPGGHDAALVDGSGLTLIHDAAGAATTQEVSSPDSDIGAPAGVAFSQDGRWLHVASVAAQGVASFDLRAGTHSSVSCDCVPSALLPMGNLFRLNEAGAAPLWMLDAGATGPRIVFVPVRAPAQ
jgi:hypothetical protein